MRWHTTTALMTTLATSTAFAGFSYDEGIDGDLSGDMQYPTSLGALMVGSNTVTATSVTGDIEYASLVVPAGITLDQIILQAYSGSFTRSFIAVQAGAEFTEPPVGTDVANLLGWTHFGTDFGVPGIGSDLLDNLGAGAGAIGFTPPLGPGTYTFWIQETGITPISYTLDFVATPTPATLLPLALIGFRRRR